METLSKADFARRIGVSDTRVSQMVREGLIGPDALVGQGPRARIIVERAAAQISARRNVGQAVGNGLMTDLGDATGFAGDMLPPRSAVSGLAQVVAENDTAKLIQLERLEQEKRKNRRETIEEAERLGRLVPADEMAREVAKAGQRLVNTFTGMAPDIANAISAKFGLPQRDVLHLVKQVMTEKRAGAAESERSLAESMPETIEAVVK